VLTPIGAALIGLGEGQSITWKTRDGRTRELRVLRVSSSARGLCLRGRSAGLLHASHARIL